MLIRNLDESTGKKLTLLLVRNVRNVPEIRKKLLSRELDCSVIKATLILDAFQVIVAANKAAIREKLGRLSTKSINSEILFNLSAYKNITQSLTAFGLGDDDKDIVIGIVDGINENKVEVIKKEIQGDYCDLEELKTINDKDLICRTYKISRQEARASSLLDSIVTRIATKDFVSY